MPSERTPKMTEPYSLIKFWAEGKSSVNAWLAINSPVSAEVMAKADWDTVTIDCQHGMVDLGQAMTMIQTVAISGKITLCRVPWNDPVWIMKFLDAGATGIVCPMVNNRAEAEAFVAACRYAPVGNRSWGPVRIPFSNPPEYKDWANKNVATLAMIETQEALDNLDDILSTPGLDAVYVGPSDLAISLGEAPDAMARAPKVIAAIEQIYAAAVKHDVIPCIHTGSGAMAKEYIAKGWRLTTIQNDLRLMLAGAATALAAARG
jgi:4-hydroxy-2-oxoheptanedioate aldolase